MYMYMSIETSIESLSNICRFWGKGTSFVGWSLDQFLSNRWSTMSTSVLRAQTSNSLYHRVLVWTNVSTGLVFGLVADMCKRYERVLMFSRSIWIEYVFCFLSSFLMIHQSSRCISKKSKPQWCWWCRLSGLGGWIQPVALFLSLIRSPIVVLILRDSNSNIALDNLRVRPASAQVNASWRSSNSKTRNATSMLLCKMAWANYNCYGCESINLLSLL